jgi:hypothetical protein
VSANYFNVFKIPLLRGRSFTEQDTTGAPGVVIINQAMARQYWPDGNPVGERITIGPGLGPGMDEPPREIVGVVGDVRDGALNREPNPIMYVPWRSCRTPTARTSSTSRRSHGSCEPVQSPSACPNPFRSNYVTRAVDCRWRG